MSRVLIADDVPAMRQLIAAVLANMGHDSVEAEDGQQVLDILEEDNQFDLIIMDINMPRINGIEAMVRAQEVSPEIKVCFLSGERDKKVVLKAISRGGADYIVKPVDPTILNEKVKKLLQKEASSQKFAILHMRAKCELVYIPLPLELTLTELSEIHLSFESNLPFLKKGVIEVLCPALTEVMKELFSVTARIEEVTTNDQGYLVKCSLVGVHETFRQKIRSIVTSQIKIQE